MEMTNDYVDLLSFDDLDFMPDDLPNDNPKICQEPPVQVDPQPVNVTTLTLSTYPTDYNSLSSMSDTDVITLVTAWGSPGQLPESSQLLQNCDTNPITRVVNGHYIEFQNGDAAFIFIKEENGPQGSTTKTVTVVRTQAIRTEYQQMTPNDLLSLPVSTTQEIPPVLHNEVDNEIKMFKLSRIEELLALEASVKDPRMKRKLANQFSQTGGKNPVHHLTRALDHLMTAQVASKFSWAGMKRNGSGKRSFKEMDICQILIDSIYNVYSESKKKSTLRLKLEDGVKEWLKRAGASSKKKGGR